MTTASPDTITRFLANFGNIIKNTLPTGSATQVIGEPGDQFIGISAVPRPRDLEAAKTALEALRGYLPDEFEGLHVFVEDLNEEDGSEGEA